MKVIFMKCLTKYLAWSSPRPWWLIVVATACGGGGGGAADGDAPTEFTAYAGSFAGFHAWKSADAAAKDGANDGLHGLGPLRVYWNEDPPHGATAFPVGTIIVKETEEADVTKRTVFAMVKRGGGFNGGGAPGWEWLSLLDDADGSVTILWRGVVAPSGETYTNQTIGDCNGCHAMAEGNDFVWDTALDLANF